MIKHIFMDTTNTNYKAASFVFSCNLSLSNPSPNAWKKYEAKCVRFLLS